jgi:tetratricopeptide (TPR) repeat protein
VRAAVEDSDLTRAAALARKALADGFEYPLLLNLRAYWHEQQGRTGEALNDLARARQLAPDDAIISNALGLCLARLSRLREARAAFQDAVRQQTDFAPAHFNLGWVTEDLGLLEEARRAFLRAEQLDAGSADPPARLAYLAARTANGETARRHAARAFVLDPRHPLAHLAVALCEFEDRHLESAEMRLRQIIIEGRTSPHERATTRGLLGDCLDAQDKVTEAFATYAACNREFASLYARQFGSPQNESVTAYLSRVIDYFGTADANAWKGKSRALPETGPVAGHVFIIGFPCSGTTLLEEVLAAHPLVCATGERDGLGAGVRKFLGDAEGLDRLSGLEWGNLQVFREMYWRELRELGLAFDGKVLVDQQPYNMVKLPLITKLFPEAKILSLTRDPRDVVFSCFRSRFRMNPANYELLTLEGAARLYDAVMRLTDIFRAKLPLTMLDIPYETLVQDFRNCMVAIYRYIGLNPEDAAWDSMNRAKNIAVGGPGTTQIARGLNAEGVGAWKRYSDQIAPVLPLLKPWIDRFGAATDE